MSLLRSIHDAWCVLTGKCHVDIPEDEQDEHFRWLQHQERASQDSQMEHQRRNNELEILMMQRRLHDQQEGKHP